MARYQYTPLPTGPKRKYIRLVKIPPGSACSGIQLELTDPVDLEDASSHSYEALSYVWGAEDAAASAKLGEDALLVAQNLAEALLHLRYASHTRVMWIDAVCIDQQNIPERSQQVAFMGEVFERATRVIVWLGGESHSQADRSVVQVYQDVALDYIAAYRSLNLLASCDIAHGQPGLPSWVPDWSTDLPRTVLFPITTCAGSLLVQASYRGSGILRVKGIHTHTIDATIPLDLDTVHTIRTTLRQAWTSLQGTESPEKDDPPFQAFCTTLATHRFPDNYEPPYTAYLSRTKVQQVIHHRLTQPAPEFTTTISSTTEPLVLYPEETHLTNQLQRLLRGCQLFRTTDSSFGRLASRRCLLAQGISSRSCSGSSNNSTQFQVVGDCYQADIMSGEPLSGPLPEGVREVAYYDGEANQVRYVDCEAGEMVVEDPRLNYLSGLGVALERDGRRQGERKEPRFEVDVDAWGGMKMGTRDFDLI